MFKTKGLCKRFLNCSNWLDKRRPSKKAAAYIARGRGQSTSSSTRLVAAFFVRVVTCYIYPSLHVATTTYIY